MLTARKLYGKVSRLTSTTLRTVVTRGHRNELDSEFLMTQPENVRKLEPVSHDMSQIFSVNSYHKSKRNFKKDLYEIYTVDATDIDKEVRHTPSTSFIQKHFPFSQNKELASNFVSSEKVTAEDGTQGR